jgi:hypothetical protein
MITTLKCDILKFTETVKDECIDGQFTRIDRQVQEVHIFVVMNKVSILGGCEMFEIDNHYMVSLLDTPFALFASDIIIITKMQISQTHCMS